jgi:hypothetical protein
MPEVELSAVAARLKLHPGPAFRKAYLANLLDSAKRFLAAGNERGAEYCSAKVTLALDEADVPLTEETTLASVPADQNEAAADGAAEPGVPDTAPSAEGEDGPRKPRPRSKAKERPQTPTEIFRRNWRMDRIKDAESILNRHGERLSALEFKTYREKLDKLREAGLSATTAAKSDRADAGLLDLRRRLYGRVLKSQRLSLRGQRMPMTLARLALSPADRSTRPAQPGLPALPTRVAPATAPGTAVRIDPAWQPVVGPYNDRYNMEDLLGLIADADPAWVEEFLDLYRGLSGMQTLMQSIASLKKT